MDNQTIKWLVFDGKAENYPAWSTKFTAYMQTKGLYKALLGKEIIPDEIAPLAEDASQEQKAEWEAKVQQRNKQIEDIQERNNTVWCHIALALDNNSLLYIRHDCLSADGVGDGAKAWSLLQQRYSNVEKPTVVSLVRQISRLQLSENEKLSEYFIRAQELMSRLTEAGEKISETLFNALVINGLPEKYEHFIVQESFNPAENFTELRTRLQNFDDSRLQRNQAEEESATAMHSGNTSGRNKGPSKPKGDCFVCGNPGHFAKQCSKRSSAYCPKCKKKGHLPKACRRSGKPDKFIKESNPFSSYSKCMNSGNQTSSGTAKPNHLIIDTGCTDHIITQKELFENLQPCSIKNVKDPKGNLTPVKGIGDVSVKLHLKNGKEEEMILRNVLYVPNYEVNLLSVNRSVKFGHKFIFKKGEAKLILNHGPHVDLSEDTGLFYLKVTFQGSSACHSATHNTSKEAIKGGINLWHQRLGHLNKDDVKRTIGCGDNLKEVCETCALGKQTSKPVPKETQNKSQKPLELVYSDILGPFEVPSLNGSKYAITFIDEHSKYSVVKFMSKKSQAFEKFKEYVAESGTPQRLRTDNGAEYTSKQFKDYCRDSKIKQEFTVPETPQQNGVAERFNRTLVEMGRSLLIQAKLPKRYWVRALSTAAHIRNLTVTINSSQGKSPFELFTGKPPRRNHLRVFGCTAYVMKRKINLKKLDSRSVKAKFIGYDDRSTAYILQEFNSQKIVKARNVIFKENEIQSFSAKETINPENSNLVSPNMDFESDRSNDEDTKIPVQDRVGENAATPVVQNQNEVEENPEEDEAALPRESRNRRPPERYGSPYTSNVTKEENVQEPRSYNEAVNSSQAENWRKAMKAEYDSLIDNNTWTLVDEPEDQQVLPGKWVYKVKYGANGQVDKLKARYVAKGYAQIEGLDFFDTYAPTCKPETFRILLATAAQKDLHLAQMDVKSAYLHSDIEEEIYLEQPQGFVKKANSGRKLVCKLNKSIYGLKQAAKNWYEALTSLLLKKGFKRSRNDYCLFVKKEEDGTFSYVLVWVDDIIVAGETEEAVNEIKSMLNENFKMDDRGVLNWFLGMQILQSHDKITVDQRKYIETVLQQFNMSDCKAVATPGEVNLKLVKNNEEQKLVDPKLYRSLVGSLLFIGKQTRPDILHIVNQLSRFLDKPDESHWKAAKHVLRYLKGTIDLRLTFSKNSNSDIIGDSDADWSGDLNDRKSTTGYYFKFEGSGGAISWEVKKQATVALSSAEAEYQAMAAAVQEAIYLRALLNDFGIPMTKPIDIGEDNQSCIKMCHNPVMHKRSKHIDTKLHFIRERVENKEVKIHYVPTEEMTADILTKSLPRVKVEKHRTILLGS